MMWHPCLRSRGLITTATILMLLDSRLAADQADNGTKPIFVTSGQEITPTAAPGSQLQYLNPGLPDFQNYIASGPKGVIGSLDSYHGFAPNGLTLSPDGKMLYVTNGGTNSLAVVDLTRTLSEVAGLVPTGYYPSDVAISHDNKTLYVVNAKSVTGPDPGFFPKNTPAENASNEYIEKDEKSSPRMALITSMPIGRSFSWPVLMSNMGQ